MRDLNANPYSPDEERIAKFFCDKGIGGGDDPLGSLMAGHDYLAWQRNRYQKILRYMLARSPFRNRSLPR